MTKFTSKRPHYEHLRKKWIAREKDVKEKLFDKHLRHITLGSLGGLMLLSAPGTSVGLPLNQSDHEIHSDAATAVTNNNRLLAAELIDKLPQGMRNLSKDEESNIAEILSKRLGMKVAGELDGKRLNRTYGMIGGEQHLYRYPGDTVHAHAKTAQDWAMYGPAGIAPGLGAWGYFVPSKAEFDEKAEMQERYYLAVQTFLSAGYAERLAEYRDFFKFRKMLVVNPKTGQAVVAVIGDAGPAEWTGKHLGGSPEVMHELGLALGPRKGEVLYFFIDDKEDKIKLGPVHI